MTTDERSGTPLDTSAGQGHAGPSSLLRNMSALLSAQLLTWIITTSVMVIVPRRVGPDAIGAYRIAMSLWAVAAVVMTFGSTPLVTLGVARDRSRSAIPLGPVFGARLVGLLAVLLPLSAFIAIVGYDTQVVLLVAIVGVGVVFTTAGEAYAAALTGLERLGPVARSDVMVKVVGAVLSIGAALLTRDIRVVAIVASLALVVGPATLAPALHSARAVDLSLTWGRVVDVFRGGWPYFVIGIALVAYNQIDVVVMSLLVSDTEIGWYGTADVLFGTMLFVPTILMTSLFPVLARRNQEDPEEAKALFTQSFMTLLLIAVPVGLGTTIVAGPLATLLYGPAFAGTGQVLAVLGVVLVLTFQTVLLGSHAVATNRQRLWTIVLGIAIPMTIVLDLVFVPWAQDRFDNGAIGGAMSYVVTEAMMLVVGIWKLAPHLVNRSVALRAAKCLLAGLVMLGATWPYREAFIAVPVVVGAVVYFLVLFATQPFAPHEQAAIARVVSRLPARFRRSG